MNTPDLVLTKEDSEAGKPTDRLKQLTERIIALRT